MNYKLLLLLLLFCPSDIYAQERLNNVKAPTSPASSILGLQPNSVLSPKSYQALEIGFYSNFQNQSGGGSFILNDFALEFTPYWAKNRGLTLEEYLYPRWYLDQLFRNSSFSIASTSNFLLGDSTASNGLAFGYRTTFYFGDKADMARIGVFKNNLRSYQRIQTRIMAVSERLILENEVINKDDFLEKIRSTVIQAIYHAGDFQNIGEAEELSNRIFQQAIFLQPLNLNNPDSFLASFYGLIDETMQANAVFDEFKSYIRERHGFSLDVAYANLTNFPTNNFEFSAVSRHSFWLTPSFRFSNYYNFLKVMGVMRFEWYRADFYNRYFPEIVVYDSNIDYGVGISSDFNKFNVQLEFVGRSSYSEIPAGVDLEGNSLFRRVRGSDFQYLVSFNYNLTDQIIFTYSIGNRFEPVQNPTNTLVSVFSLNFGFGAPTRDNLDLDR